MKVWYHAGSWHLSTNGTINAFAAPVGDFNITFGQLFERALGYDVQKLGEALDKEYTYCFELTSPESHLVVDYDSAVWYLSAFNTQTGMELDWRVRPILDGVRYPREYDLKCLEDVLEVVNEMDKTHEGVVVSDDYSNRVKVKSPVYLAAAHLANNGNITKKRVLEYIRTNQIDDFIALCPQYRDLVDMVKNAYIKLIKEIEVERDMVSRAELCLSRKEFALMVKDFKWKTYLFLWFDNHNYSPENWINDMPSAKVADLILI